MADLSKLSDKDLLALKSGDLKSVSDEGLKTLAGKSEPGIGSKALDYGLRALDYAGGYGRVLGGTLAGQATLADLEKALVGQAPPTSEFIQRAGGGEMGSLSEVLPSLYSKEGKGLSLKQGGPLDITGRGALGFVGDVALDPLTYTGVGPVAKALGKAGKVGQIVENVANPVSNLLQSSGKSMYKSGLKKIDQQSLLFGKEPVSELLWKNRVTGSATSIAEQMDTMAERLLKERDAIIQKATEAGGTVNMNAAMQETADHIAKLRASQDPLLQPVADALEAEVKKYTALGSHQVAAPTSEYINAAKIHELEKAKYAQDLANFEKASADYGKAGATRGQDILPGQVDVGQKTAMIPEQLTLGGPDLTMAAQKVEQAPFQYSLLEIPQKKVNVKGGISQVKRDNPLQITAQMGAQEPTFGMQQLGIENWGTKPASELEKILVERKGVVPAPEGFQTSMIFEPPTPPRAPVAPQMPTIMTPGITPVQASGMKTSLYQGLPKGAYQEMIAASMGVNPAMTRGKKIMAGGLKTETENAVGRALGQGELDAVQKANMELGQLLTTKDKQQMQAFLEQNKNAVTSVDMSGLGFALAGTPAAIPILATKKLGDISKTTGFRTGMGSLMYDLGASGLPRDTYYRRLLIDQNK
jgi:hypothetical protein